MSTTNQHLKPLEALSMLFRRHLQMSLPEELCTPGSDLDVLLNEIEEPGAEKRINFRTAIRQIRHSVHNMCPQYRPSLAHKNDCLCRSGEISGQPFRGAKCLECRVSQFSPSGFFTGEITGPVAGL
jgi:hypothetical protein